MVNIIVNQLALNANETLEAMDYELSDTIDFSNIINSSYEDYDNLNGILFPDNLELGKKYWVRARALLNTGYTIWSNLYAFYAKDINDIPLNINIPSSVNTPKFVENTIFNRSRPTMFELKIEESSVANVNGVFETTWWIEDLNGKVVWSLKDSQTNKYSVYVDSVILKSNRIYVAKVMVRTGSDDVSNVGSMLMRVSYDSRVRLETSIYDLDVTIDNEIITKFIPNVTGLKFEIIGKKNGDYSNIVNGEVTTNSFILPANTLIVNASYLLGISLLIDGTYTEYTYFHFVTS